MVTLPSRQVHLDFHTSELIPRVGSRFNKENFQQALKLGHVNSITIFAKCHHSWCYYPSKVGRIHPELDFDLTGAMIEAAHEIGVRAPIYITVGWSANDAESHPEWLARNNDGSIQTTEYDLKAAPTDKKPIVSWENLCPNGLYAEHIYAITKEICQRYDVVDGLFYDICFLGDVCCCVSCVEGMKREGLDPENLEDAKKYYIINRQQFMEKCTKILREEHKEGTIFFNGGAEQYRSEFHAWQSHFEMEDLPTTWGGYDKMPPRAKFFARTGKDYLGMTGKFHTMWGEFGGFKNPKALKYECASMLSYGARCSVGDQMHPCGEMDMGTYEIIGEAYKYVEDIEDYCYGTEETSCLGIILSSNAKSDEGLVKMLLENQLDFDIVMSKDDLTRFDTIILPDSVLLGSIEAKRVNEYIKNGGKVLLTGESGLNKSKESFLIDIGAEYIGSAIFENDYLTAGDQIGNEIVKSPFLFYEGANRVNIKDGQALAQIKEPYFNRTYAQYCSHQNAPYKQEFADYPAAVRKGNVVYLAHPVCRMYFEHGAQMHRDYFINALRLLYKEPVMSVDMLSSGRARFVRQLEENRYILHLLYATPIQRGRTLVIEDLPVIYNINARLMIKEKIKRASLEPQDKEIPFTQENGIVTITVPSVECHQIVAFEY